MVKSMRHKQIKKYITLKNFREITRHNRASGRARFLTSPWVEYVKYKYRQEPTVYGFHLTYMRERHVNHHDANDRRRQRRE